LSRAIFTTLARQNLNQSQKGALALRLEKQLAEAAKLCRRATQNNNGGKAVVAGIQPKYEFIRLSLENSGFSQLSRKAMEWLSEDTTSLFVVN
jgi:hypothetical protein